MRGNERGRSSFIKRTHADAGVSRVSARAHSLLIGRKSLSGSVIGSIAEMQEMLDFCGKHNITADIEIIPIERINAAYERMAKGDVKYRFAIDMTLLKEE